jgi:hypothetical protein
LIAPGPRSSEKLALRLLRQVEQDGFDLDLHGIAIFIEITSVIKIMLLDDRPPEQALRSQHQFKRLADRGLADVVAADQKRVAVEINNAMRDAPEIRDGQSPDAHCVALSGMNQNNRCADERSPQQRVVRAEAGELTRLPQRILAPTTTCVTAVRRLWSGLSLHRGVSTLGPSP